MLRWGVLIERPAKNARVTVFSARPVLSSAKGRGHRPASLRSAEDHGRAGPRFDRGNPQAGNDAQLIADSIAQQLEKRIMFRRAMKRAMQNAMRLGAQGIKIMSSGPSERC